MRDLLNQHWDVVVIGTGIGGGTIGRVLAEGGARVLFVEKGPLRPLSERQEIHSPVTGPEARLIRGFWPVPLRATIDGVQSSFFAPIGAGVGGSSAFYAATLERPERRDFEDHPTASWPVSFDQMQPFYAEAERMYSVSGTHDPLSSEPDPNLPMPAALDPCDAQFMADFQKDGLHPYRLHNAFRHDAKDPAPARPQKMDARAAGVDPALETGRAALLDRCSVTRLICDGPRVTGLDLHRNGQDYRLNADRVILSGGALGSPHLLLASANKDHPAGISNSNDLVGRYLMFHLNEIFALWPSRKVVDQTASKAISLRDLYHVKDMRFGTVQSMGITAGYGEILHFLRVMLARSMLRKVPFAQNLLRFPAAFAQLLLGNAKVFVGLLEDFGYRENRVVFDPAACDHLNVEYQIGPELRTRRKAFRKALRRAFKTNRHLFLTLQPELNFGHPCGTLRFGKDPASSVLDLNCRAHEMRNLWVVDSSFMPTSFGVNPSLTIAANAIRVGQHLLKEMGK